MVDAKTRNEMNTEPSPDLKRCQSRLKSGSFMTLGPRQWNRCRNATTTVVSVRGQGSMGVCDDCIDAFKKYATLKYTLRPVSEFIARKKKKRVIALPSNDAISKVYAQAAEAAKREDHNTQSTYNPYFDGVRAALEWVLGLSKIDPME